MTNRLQQFTDGYNHERVNWDKLYKIYGKWLTSVHARDGLDPWQVDDWKFLDAQLEACILRSRKASKTTDLMDWLILRVASTAEKWAWLAAQMGQLTEAYFAALQHPWVVGTKWVLKKQYIELINGNQFVFGNLSLSQLGLGLHGVIIDEEQSMEKKQAEDVYPQMRPMLAITNGKIIHTGTRWIDTPFDYNVDHYPTRTRDWTQCEWLYQNGSPETFIAREIASGVRPNWEIDLLYRCLPTLPGGSVFPNIIDITGEAMPECHIISQGVDFNGNPGHTMIRLGHCSRGLVALKEELFRYHADDQLLQQRVQEYPTEVESGGWNDVHAPNLTGVTKRPFTEGNKQYVDPNGKPERIRRMLKEPLLVNRQVTPHLWVDLHKARYDFAGKVDTGSLHWLAAAMHAVTAQFQVFTPQDSAPQGFGVNMDLVRLRAGLGKRRNYQNQW